MVRISGPDALTIGDGLFSFSNTPGEIDSHRMYYGRILDSSGDVIDRGLFVFMKGPGSFTGEDIVELHCHGGPLLMETILISAIALGAKTAGRGEFTRRAFMNGKIDLTRAEAVVDLISSVTRKGLSISAGHLEGRLHREIEEMKGSLVSLLAEVETSIDFSEEDLDLVSLDDLNSKLRHILSRTKALMDTYREGRIYREGASVVICGRPNVGKSSLLNLLLERDRAIVTPEPGTTRDIIWDFMNIDGVPIRLIDTCGIRDSDSPAEREGVIRARDAISNADLILLVVDLTLGMESEEYEVIEAPDDGTIVVVFNKVDLLPYGEDSFSPPPLSHDFVITSALTGSGIVGLKKKIRELTLKEACLFTDETIINNARHYEALGRAGKYLEEVMSGVKDSLSPELLAIDLRGAIGSLGEISGEVCPEDVLDVIFSRFCIGK